MELTIKAECHVSPTVGFPVHLNWLTECGSKKIHVGEITKTRYVGNYVREITAEIDEAKIDFLFPGDCRMSLRIQNPYIVVDEYADELAGYDG